jgi:predicted RNA-binding Zn-ribbon protein involved in translation (DUF1610 family)
VAIKGPNDPTAINPSQDPRAVRLAARRVKGKGYVAQCPKCGYETPDCSASGIAQGELAVHLVMGCNNENAAAFEAAVTANMGTALDPVTCKTCIGKGVDPAWNSNGRPCPDCNGSGNADLYR